MSLNQHTIDLKKNNISYDYIRVFAALLVIVLHTSAAFTTKKPFVADYNYISAIILNGFSRVCVPLFIMLSGALLLNKRICTKKYYQTRFLRILPPFCFWLLFAAFYTGCRMESAGKVNYTVLWNNFIKGHSFYHLWYMYMLIGLYLIVPVIAWIKNRISERMFLLLTGTAFCISMIRYTCLSAKTVDLYWIFWFVDYLGYFMAGSILKKVRLHKNSYLLLLYFICSVMIICCELFPLHRAADFYYFNYNHPFVVAASLALFSFLSGLKYPQSTYISKSAGMTFGIYLVHGFVLDTLIRAFKNSWLFSHSEWGIPFLLLSTLLFSWLTIRVLQSTRIGRWVC